MKKRNWPILLAIAACVALYFGYRTVDNLRTDTTAPEITFSEEALAVSVADPKDALLQGVTAKDDRDGDVSASVVVERVRLTDPDGTILVRYAAFDRAGNVVKAEREARYTDYESPRFSLSAPLLFAASTNLEILDLISATDAVDGNIRHRIRATSLDGKSLSAKGSHEVEFRVTNSVGDTVRLALPVEIYSAEAYDMDVTLTDYLVYLESGSSFSAKRYLSSVTRNRETVSLRGGTPEHYAVKIDGDVDTRTPGVYAVDYTVTYTVANERNPEDSQIYTGCTRLIVVVEG